MVTIFSNLVKLKLETMLNLKELCHGPSPSNFLQKLVALDLFSCSKLQNILFVGNLNLCNLKSMRVTDCPTLTSLFTLCIAHNLELLETLEIRSCNRLKYIIADQRGTENEENIVPEKDEHYQKISDGSVFPKLKSIAISFCDSLEWIFPVSVASGLEQLEEMRIWKVAELKNIFGQYQHEDHPLHENAKEIILPSLRTIRFFEIPNFISIFPIYYHPSDQPLQSIDLELKLLTDSEKSTYKNSDWVLPAAIAPCLSKQLLEIKLSSIPKLVSLFKLSTAQEMLLEHLQITNCHELKHIIANEEEDHDDNNYDSVTVFPKLRRLVVRKCSILKMLLPVSLAHGLVQLEPIELKEAPQLEYVFGRHDDHLSHQIENHIHIEFPALKELDLAALPRMISICSRNYYPTWPSLKSLGLSKCPLLKISSIIDCIIKKGSRENVNEDNQSRIEVQALENMLNLEKLDIDDDGELEGIFLLEGLPSSRQQTQLSSRLRRLELKDLPKLRHICKTSLLLSFQNLESLIVQGCGKLSYVFSASVLRDLPQLEKLFIRDCDQLEQIIEDEEDHKVCFPALSHIDIQRCNKLKTLFCINTSNAFPELCTLMIEEASQLEVVFTHEMCNVEDNLMLPSLSYLSLVKLPSLVSVCHGFKLLSVKRLDVMDCPKLASTSTATAESFPHEYQNAADEKNMEANEKEEEENIRGAQMAVVDNSCSTETNVMSQDKGKQPAESVLTSNERKDPQTSTNHEEENHSEEEEKREVRMAVVQSTTPSVDENFALAETDNAISDIVLTNLRSEDDYPGDDECKEAEVQEKEQQRKDHMGVAQTTATSIDDNSALAESNTAVNQDKVQVPSDIVLTNPYGGRDIAPQMTTNEGMPINEDHHSGDKEEKMEVHVEMVQTTTQIRDDNLASAATSNANHQAKSNTALTNPNERRNTAPQITIEGPSDVSVTPSRLCSASSFETSPSSISLLPTIHAPSPEVDPSVEEYANFRDIGSVKKKHIPLLEEAIVKYPSLWTWRGRFQRSHIKQSGYISLGDMLEFLASTKWKDLTEEKNSEFESLVDELEFFKFDIQWLQKTREMIEERKKDDETINRMKTLEEQVMEQEIEVQKAKEKLEKTKLELDAIRAKIGKFDDFIGF